MRYRYLQVTLLFLFVMSAAGRSGAQWLKTITANALNKPVTGKYATPSAGYALYFSQAGNINVPYLVYVPKSYNPSVPLKVVVFLHGAILARDSFQYKESSIADEPIFSVADKYNVLVVFPFARADFAWGRNEAANENIITILNQVEKVYNADKKGVYIGGISMGGNATYWFVNNKADVFAGFYAFSSLPREGSVVFSNIKENKPLYTMNAKDDQTFDFGEAETVFNKHRKEAPGWHFSTVTSGGHRFIYGSKGKEYTATLISSMLSGSR
jgi:predicted peptidase